MLASIEQRVGQYIPLEAEGGTTQLFVSQLTREHLRKTIKLTLAASGLVFAGVPEKDWLLVKSKLHASANDAVCRVGVRRNPQTRGSEENIMSPNAAVVATQNVTVKDHANDKSNHPGKLADAEIQFVDGVFAGLKLIGFAIWERRTGAGRNVTFPARANTR